MASFQITLTPTRRAAGRFISSVRRALLEALVEEKKTRGLTQAQIARELNVHRSVINRELRGFKDISVGRIAELAWVLGREAKLELLPRKTAMSGNIMEADIVQSPMASVTTQLAPVDVTNIRPEMSTRAA